MEKLYPKSKGPETESPFFGKKATSISGTTYSHQSHELPPLETLRETCVKSGHLKKLCGRGILSPGTWKDRFGLLQENQLYLYEIQDGDGKEKGIGVVIDLSNYDTVTEAPTRVTRKAANVFCLGTSDKRFFDSSGRHYFATETAAEMKGWVSALESSVGRNAGSNGTSNKGDEETTDSTTRRKNKKNTTASLKIRPETKMRSSVVPPKESEEEKSQIILGGTLPRSSGQLDCGVAKSRAKGPPGRRLPRSAAKVPPAASPSSLETLETDGGSTAPAEFRDARGRATSLSALEHHNYPSPEEGLRVQTRSTISTHPSPLSELTNNNSNSPNPSRNSRLSGVDFEHAWFLKFPPKSQHHGSQSGDEKTSDYSSLHDELSVGSTSQSSSVDVTPLRRHPESDNDSPSPRPPSSVRRYFCAIL